MARIAIPESQVDLDEKYDLVAVEAAIKNIEAAYSLGQKSLKKHGESLYSNPNGIIPAFAADKGLRRDAVQRARQFARVFTQKDVREICRECRKQNFPLGVSLIYRVLPLGDADKCMRLLQRAIRKRWTQRRMAAEIHKRPGAKSFQGRPRAMPKSPTEACLQIVSRVVPVLRWLEEVKSEDEGALVGGLASQVDRTIAALKALARAASRRGRPSR